MVADVTQVFSLGLAFFAFVSVIDMAFPQIWGHKLFDS